MTAPTLPREDALLAELDSLSFSGRIRRAAAVGRAHAADPALPALLDALLAGDAYRGALAVWVAQAARRVDRLAAALAHRSLLVRRLATLEFARLVPDAPGPAPAPPGAAAGASPGEGGGEGVPGAAEVAALVHAAAPALRRELLKGLVRAGKHGLARSLFDEVLARYGPAEAAPLLASLDDGALRARLPELAHAVAAWRPLFTRHPEAVLAYLVDRLEASPPRERPLVLLRHAALVGAAFELRPAAAFGLVERFADAWSPYLLWPRLGVLARVDAERLVRLLELPRLRELVARQGLPKCLVSQAHRFSPAQHARLGRLVAANPALLAGLLEAIAPGRREALLAEVYAGEDGSLRVWPDELLDRLPRALQRREAARMLGLAAIRNDAERVKALSAYLHPDEAAPALLPATRATDAQERGRALALLVTCAGRAGRVGGALGLLATRLKNDQDPVRMLALQALARAPAGAFAPDDAEALGAVATDALEARDTSHATRQALQQVALMLLRTRAAEADGRLFEAGLALLRALAARAGTLRLPDLSRGLPRRAAPSVVAALAPHIAAANARERPELVLALAAALGARGHDLPELARLLEPLVDAKPDAVAARAIDLLLANPRGRDGRVRALLDRDPSAFVLPAVLQHVHRRRQDWLDPFLDGTPLAGRFLTGRTLYLPPLYAGFHRWLPRQQRAFARLARPAGRDPGQAQAARVLFIGQLARLPVSGVADFEPFLQSGEVPTIEAALGALAWLDEPAEALPVLLGHLEGDRARVATYALPRVARFVGGPALAPLLAGLAADPGRKITVRKEALRLLGERRDPASVPALERVLAQPKLPKDVAVAVGHAARNLLDDPRAFGLLERLARSPEPDVARSLLAPSPERLPASARPSYAAIVLALAWHPDASTRRAAATALAAWSVGQEDAIAARLAEIVVDLAGGDAWREAGATLVALAADGAGLDALGHALETLAGRARDPGPAPLERDRPALRRLHDLAQRLLDAPLDARLRLGPRLAGLADRLRDDDAWPLAAALRVAAIDLSDVEGAAGALLALAARPLAEPFAGELRACFGRQLSAAAERVAPAARLALARRLAAGTPPAALLAVSAVASAGGASEWPAEARALLEALRCHDDVRVRHAAAQIVVRPEP